MKKNDELIPYDKLKKGHRQHDLILIGRKEREAGNIQDEFFEDAMSSLSVASASGFEEENRLSISVGGARTSFSSTTSVVQLRSVYHYYSMEDIPLQARSGYFTRRLCHVAKIHEDTLEVSLYNWNTTKRKALADKLQKQIEWIRSRHKIGMSFIYQKLGLFE